MSKKPMLILISGPSGAGKGLLAKKVGEKLGKSISILSTDNYDKGIHPNYTNSSDKLNPHKKFAYELDKDKILPCIKALLNGEATKSSLIFTTRKMPNSPNIVDTVENQQDEIEILPSEIIFVEGIHALQDEDINSMADLKLYVHASDGNLLVWKIKRSPWYRKLEGKEPKDPRNFGQDFKSAFWNFYKRSKAKQTQVVEPQKKYADLILINDDWKLFEKNTKKVAELVDLYLQEPEKFKAKLAKEFQTKEKEQISLWKQPTTYLLIASGVGITLLFLGIYQLLKRAKSKKPKKTILKPILKCTKCGKTSGKVKFHGSSLTCKRCWKKSKKK